MHKYLRAIGFSNIETREQLNRLLLIAEDCYQSERTSGEKGCDFSERKKEFAPGIGLIVCGEYDDRNRYHRNYYFPYFEGMYEHQYEDVIVERHASKEAYSAVCDENSLGVTLIFYVQNAADYLYDKRCRAFQPGMKHPATVRISGLSVEGKVLLPVIKGSYTPQQKTEDVYQHNRMIQAAREGDEDAIESLTLEDMDTYSMIAQRIQKEDVFSIVSTYFMPYGVECDLYNIMGEILKVDKVENPVTEEEIYKLAVDSNGLVFEVCINKNDLMGQPEVGRRFKGICWLQGQVIFY